jgi:hypothetical protein
MQLRELLALLLDRDDIRVEIDERALERAERVWEQPPG